MTTTLNWRIAKIGESKTIEFAVAELEKYIRLMDKTAMVDVIFAETYNGKLNDALWVGIDNAFYSNIPSVKNEELDDAIYINVVNGKGVITGSNPRSVLIAVYRYLSELGCAFLRPGLDGEVIPQRNANTDTVFVKEAASYRHRSVCIEGAVSYEHVRNMIDWMPKVGMNGYFNQFMVPFTFFDRWYSHGANPMLTPEPITSKDVEGMVKSYVSELKKRGMRYHAVGHGWTCDPFGIPGTGWDVKDVIVPEEAIKYFAQVEGKRELWGGIPLNTNLCYSNSEVRERMTDAMVEFCAKNPDVDYLHFWLADGSNNHCECEKCVEKPSDYYVMMLNLLDEKLTAKRISTKVVFLIYVDLLWEPEKEKLRNPDRFVLMFAPITRTYTNSFVNNKATDEIKLKPYVKNKLEMPRTVEENIARLKKWQNLADCDSFDFDYHFMWDHFLDPGYYSMAKVLGEDMSNLHSIGLNGMLSCQNQRVFFPTSLGMLSMARTLWNKDICFEEIASDYFKEAFGEDGAMVSDYLCEISRLFDSEYLRGEKAVVNSENAMKLRNIPTLVGEFLPIITQNLKAENPPTVTLSWQYLAYHATYCILLSNCLEYKAEGNMPEAYKAWKEVVKYLRGIEQNIHNVFDLNIFFATYNGVVNR